MIQKQTRKIQNLRNLRQKMQNKHKQLRWQCKWL